MTELSLYVDCIADSTWNMVPLQLGIRIIMVVTLILHFLHKYRIPQLILGKGRWHFEPVIQAHCGKLGTKIGNFGLSPSFKVITKSIVILDFWFAMHEILSTQIFLKLLSSPPPLALMISEAFHFNHVGSKIYIYIYICNSTGILPLSCNVVYLCLCLSERVFCRCLVKLSIFVSVVCASELFAFVL